MYPGPEKGFSSLIRDLDPSVEGERKKVFKASDGQRTLAAKVFKTQRDDGTRVNRQRESWNELNWYGTVFHRRELNLWPYTPQPFYLLTDDQDKPIGLAVEWIEGKSLSTHDNNRLLVQDEFHEFSSALAECIMAGFAPHPIMYSEDNILFTPRRPKPLAFSTCRIFKIPESRKDAELYILAENLEPLKRYVA